MTRDEIYEVCWVILEECMVIYGAQKVETPEQLLEIVQDSKADFQGALYDMRHLKSSKKEG